MYPDRDKKGPVALRRKPTAASRKQDHPDRDDSIGAFVRQRRRRERVSQRALAELAGVAPRVVWELEHGKPTMRMDVVNAVLAVFGKRLGVADAPRPEIDE
jgi:y4mF family transcriptional regulator